MSLNRNCSYFVAAVCLLCAFVVLPSPSLAQSGPGDPKPDVNIVGPTRDPADIRDEGLKQQNEPACAIRPGDGDCIICFFNDYRTVDIPGHEDAWIGMSESCDVGDTWTSRIVPGHPGHAAPIDAKFAADPRVIAIPGMAIHGFIGGFRDQDRGAIAVQHWLENNKEDFDHNEPANLTTIVDLGTEGRFIDKPEFHAVLDDGDPQATISLSFEMENTDLGTITRVFPAGTLYAAYAVFTGSQSVKLLVKKSATWGTTWRNKTTKLTESQNLVSGITMTSKGDMVMAMWRQVLDTNDVDAMYYAYTTNGGKSWTKPKLLNQICKFDQPSATLSVPPQVTFRTNDFPWLANDGKNIYVFYTERSGDCLTGVPQVVMRHTADGSNWSTAQVIDSSPGGQFMPAAFGARGKVQVAWYDTRREGLAIDATQPFIADYIPASGVRVNRKVDVYTLRVTSDDNGNNVQVSDSIRVSQYRTIADVSNPSGPKFEIEASFGNAMMYRSGFLAFLGDYLAVTGQAFRSNGSGGWEENQSPLPAPASNLTDFFIAYADHRDVRGDVLFGDGGMTKPYTPPDNVPAVADNEAPIDIDSQKILVADNDEVSQHSKSKRRSSEGVDDAFTDPATACVLDADRTRDANIYGAVIRDRLRLSTPVPSRPLSGILRAIPFVARDVTSVPSDPPEETPYRLYIATQPGPEPTVHRASFRQTPDRAPFASAPSLVDLVENVLIPPNSAVARTVFLVSPDIDASATVQIFDGDCAVSADLVAPLEFTLVCDVLGSISLGGSGTAGILQQPDYLSTVCESQPEDCNVAVTELHNPLLENPLLENPLLENPLLENPLLENMELEAPLLENPLLENFGFENPLLENPLLENPLLENPLLENPLLENPLLENPLLENSSLDDGVTYTDVTAVVRNDGNVTTAYNFDATAANFESTAGGAPVSQIILWKQYVYGTSRDCRYVPEVRNQVITTINQPDSLLTAATIEDPFGGAASMILAPGERGFVTYRFFGTPEELAQVGVNGFTASSQAANCDEFDDEVGPPPGGGDFYECEDQIADDRERILIEIDSTPPSFDGLMQNQRIPAPPIEANAPGGACVDPVATGLVSATDAVSETVSIQCVNAEGNAICIAAGETGLSVPVSNLVADPGASPMTCTATDELGNSASINLFLDVVDTTSPFFTSVPTNPTTVIANDVSGTAAPVLESGLAGQDVSGVDPVPAIACATDSGFLSGDAIPIGEHNVVCRITDASGNFAETSYTLQVLDVTAPVFTSLPGNIVAEAVTAGGVVVNYAIPQATDNDGTNPAVNCVPSSGSTFVIGTTTVTCTATDSSGNSSQVTFAVTVADTTPPVVSVPLEPVFGALQNASGAIVNFSSLVTASDNIDPSPMLTCAPSSASLFAAGDTTVDCTATDASGNSASASFTVTVGYAGGIGIFSNKVSVKAGSSNPLSWAWQDDQGNNIDSSFDLQLLRIADCSDPSQVVLDMAGDPGSSGFRFKSDLSWEYNWQSDDQSGNPLPKGTFCVVVESSVTGQTLVSPAIRIR